MIGKGTFGQVVIVEHKKSGNERAVKIVSKSNMIKKGVDFSLLENEARIMMEIDHPNIVKLFEVFEDEKYLYFVMEYLKGGNLHEHFIKHTKNKFTESMIRVIFR